MPDLNINKILVIDKSEKFRRVLVRFFSKRYPNAKVKGYDPNRGCPDNTFPWHKFDLLILNFKVGEKGNGLDWLKICKTGDKFPATIITTDRGHEKIAVGAFRYGAQDYLSKEGLTTSKLNSSISRAMNKHVGDSSKDDEQLLQGKLVNRVKFYQRLNDAHEDGALLLVTIDKFNEIHNTIGLIPADELTSHLAEVIVKSTASIKAGNIEIIRINDDTIAAIVVEAENDAAYTRFAENICKDSASSPFEYEGKPIDYKISIGIAYIKESSRGAKTNIACADAAVRLAMDKKENSFVVFGGSSQSTNVADQKLVLHIQNSIKEDRVQPFFQPIISVSEATEGFDTTIYQLRTKIIDLNGQLLGYDEFSPVLKQNKLAKNLDYWVIRHVLHRLYKIKKEGKDKLGFLVALEEDSLLDKGLINWVDKLISHFKEPSIASSIMFEIRSEHFITHQDNVVDIMMQLRDKYGISFALTNVQGLSILNTCTHQTSFEFVKIPMYERSDSGEEKAVDTEELRQLINGASELGSLTIADRIDNADYLSTAIECGADFVSGYLVHPPQEDISSEDEVVM
ncbi:MAG: diguanylate cyclase (GGDEF)-like protein [Gammaproteobacteria bacterium]|jgi:diguanylate cyclase (GGDEF)-like protein